MAADVTPPGTAIVVRDAPYEIAAFLRTKPASALPGIGPKTARTLARYGITFVGDIADTHLPTLQRILGVTAARQAHDRAHGIDERPVVPGAAPKSLGAGHRFDRDELDPEQHHRTMLRLVQELGARLRTASEIAQALTLTVSHADRTQTTRSRTFNEPTAHTPRWPPPPANSSPASVSSVRAYAPSPSEPNASGPPKTQSTNSPSTTATTSSAALRQPSTRPPTATDPTSWRPHRPSSGLRPMRSGDLASRLRGRTDAAARGLAQGQAGRAPLHGPGGPCAVGGDRRGAVPRSVRPRPGSPRLRSGIGELRDRRGPHPRPVAPRRAAPRTTFFSPHGVPVLGPRHTLPGADRVRSRTRGVAEQYGEMVRSCCSGAALSTGRCSRPRDGGRWTQMSDRDHWRVKGLVRVRRACGLG
ncbi:DNA polymerase Y family protein [Streptomyces microflavus]